MMTARPQILCISLSDITTDARVLRQISVLAEYGDVTTVGYGTLAGAASAHIEVPRHLKTLPQTPTSVLGLALRRHRMTETAAPAIAFVIDALRDRRFDLVVANEARVLALADHVAHGAPIWADMHEWAPEERTHILSWRLLVAPLMTHLCRTYLPRAAAVTTVGGAIADLYRERFGVTAEVMRNSGRRRDLTPTPPDGERIRLVHSGVAVHGRRLELMIEALALLDDRFSLDLYLLPAGDGGAYLRRLRDLAAADDRIRFHDGVPPDALPQTLNAYDVGVFWLPPAHTNARLTLPNKFFDFVQARLAVAIGPSIEMVQLTDAHHLGVVAADFTAAACAASLREITTAELVAYKQASDDAAEVLSFDTDADVARRILSRLLSDSPRSHPAEENTQP